MGLMQKFRQNMPAVIIFLIVMFVALIVFEWGDASRGSGPVINENVIGEVNGTEISAVEFNSRVNNIIEGQRQANPDGEIDEERIREMVWQQMVEEVLVKQTAERLGIFVSDDELREALLFDPPPALKQPFTDTATGNFRQADFFAFMRDIDGFLNQRGVPPEEIQRVKLQIKQLEEALRYERLRQGVESVVTASAIPSPGEARAAFDDQRAKASGSFVMIDAMSISDSAVAVTDEEAKKYYDDHKAEFQQKASREVRYAMFQLNPSAQDSSTVQKRLTTVLSAISRASTPALKDSAFQSYVSQYGAGNYDGNRYVPMQELSPEMQNVLAGAGPGDMVGPVRLSDGNYLIQVADVKDSGEVFVKAQHILLRTTGTKDDSVKAEADKIAARAKGGENFATLAQQFSGDPGSATRGGDLGFFKKGTMVKQFDEAAFAAPTGAIVGPVKTDFGYHIIKVTDRSAKSYKIRDLRFEPRVSNMTKTQLRARAQQFRDKLAEGGSIDSIAAPQKLQVLESGPIDRAQAAGGSMELTNFAYEGQVGDVSDVIVLTDGSLIVGQISKIRTAGVMEFADAKEGIITRLRLKKKLDMLQPRAAKLRAALSAGDSLSKLMTLDSSVQVRPFNDATRTTPFPGVGFDYALTNAVFSLKPGQTSDLIRGERGYYIAAVNNISQPTDKEYETEKPQFIQQLTTQRRQQMYQEWLQKERERAAILDHRQGR
jgi:parvulin-like peptidyl-prolyl isomerase